MSSPEFSSAMTGSIHIFHLDISPRHKDSLNVKIKAWFVTLTDWPRRCLMPKKMESKHAKVRCFSRRCFLSNRQALLEKFCEKLQIQGRERPEVEAPLKDC